jgi:hypothetical protein
VCTHALAPVVDPALAAGRLRHQPLEHRVQRVHLVAQHAHVLGHARQRHATTAASAAHWGGPAGCWQRGSPLLRQLRLLLLLLRWHRGAPSRRRPRWGGRLQWRGVRSSSQLRRRRRTAHVGAERLQGRRDRNEARNRGGGHTTRCTGGVQRLLDVDRAASAGRRRERNPQRWRHVARLALELRSGP